MRKNTTNIEFVTELMDFSTQGALMQMYVLTALEYYSGEIKDCTEEQWNTNMISLPAWKRCADEFLAEYKKRCKS
jgi:hypothetical protein